MNNSEATSREKEIFEKVSDDLFLNLKVKRMSGEEAGCKVVANGTVRELKEQLLATCSTPPDQLTAEGISLVHQTIIMQPDSQLLSSYNLQQGDTVHVVYHRPSELPASTLGQPSAPPKKSFHCAFLECMERAVKIIGECSYCGLRFCSQHRIPESHLCSDLQTCKKQSFDSNELRVMRGKCISNPTI